MSESQGQYQTSAVNQSGAGVQGSAGSGGAASVIQLNVGGVLYTTTQDTLTGQKDSFLAQLLTAKKDQLQYDSKGRIFIDRDGILFRYILDFLRNGQLILPENFLERQRLKQESEFYNLPELASYIDTLKMTIPVYARDLKLEASTQDSPVLQPQVCAIPPIRAPGYITVGYRGTFAFGRDGLADVKFRKLSRILICGRVALCREVFGETLNESRDPDRGATDRYSCRFFLKHTFLEQAFDALQEAGFKCVTSCASGTSSCGTDTKPGMDSEENRWGHYNEFVFYRN